MRIAEIYRETAETDIKLQLDLDGVLLLGHGDACGHRLGGGGTEGRTERNRPENASREQSFHENPFGKL